MKKFEKVKVVAERKFAIDYNSLAEYKLYAEPEPPAPITHEQMLEELKICWAIFVYQTTKYAADKELSETSREQAERLSKLISEMEVVNANKRRQ